MSLGVAIAAAVLATVRLVPDGVLGQTGSKGAFVDWTSCRSCALDADGNVVLDGGWRIPAGGMRAERIPAGQKPEIVRESFANGFSADAVRFTVGTARREVVGWAADGRRIGPVFSFEGKLERPDLAITASAYPKTGDLLIGTKWPCME